MVVIVSYFLVGVIAVFEAAAVELGSPTLEAAAVDLGGHAVETAAGDL